MTPHWPFGEAHIEGLLRNGELDLVAPDRGLALKYLEQAEQHLRGSEAAHDVDPTGSFNLAYDAARKAMTALLLTQGLRPKGDGGHRVVQEAVLEQVGSAGQEVFGQFRWMRQLRNDSQYPAVGKPVAGSEEAVDARTAARDIIEKASELVRVMPPFQR